MNTMTPDPDAPHRRVEIRGPDGKTMGFFTPAGVEQGACKRANCRAHRQAELARRKTVHTMGRTTREMFDRLKSMTQDPDLVAHLKRMIEDLKK